jgi:hypothetical protein
MAIRRLCWVLRYLRRSRNPKPKVRGGLAQVLQVIQPGASTVAATEMTSGRTLRDSWRQSAVTRDDDGHGQQSRDRKLKAVRLGGFVGSGIGGGEISQ